MRNPGKPAAARVSPFGAPSWLLFGTEPLRAVSELAAVQFINPKRLPPGDGHPEVLFTGLASDARAMRPLRSTTSSASGTASNRPLSISRAALRRRTGIRRRAPT